MGSSQLQPNPVSPHDSNATGSPDVTGDIVHPSLTLSQGDSQENVILVPELFSVSQGIELKQMVQSLCTASPDLQRLALDFQQTQFMDSSGIGSLIACRRLLGEQQVELVLRNLSSQVRLVLELTELDQVLNIEPELPPELSPELSTAANTDSQDRDAQSRDPNGATSTSPASTASSRWGSRQTQGSSPAQSAQASGNPQQRQPKSPRARASQGNSQAIVTHPSVHSRAKRLLDIVGAIVGLGLTALVALPIIIAIKLEDGGPIFFAQRRCSWLGRPFTIWKFRSMVTDAEARKAEVRNEVDGALFKSSKDHRITRIGKLLRRTSLDELPQFWNVLRGEMSLVGTRPPTLEETEQYEIPQWRRLDIKPGMTGEWQVNGRSTVKTFEDVVQLDLKYQRNWTLWYDIKLIVKTILVVFRKDSGAL